jgi:predicted transcriptional regulator
MPLTIDHLLDKLRRSRRRLRLTHGQLAVQAGLTHKALNAMDGPDWNPTAETLRALEDVIRAWPRGNSEGGRAA